MNKSHYDKINILQAAGFESVFGTPIRGTKFTVELFTDLNITVMLVTYGERCDAYAQIPTLLKNYLEDPSEP